MTGNYNDQKIVSKSGFPAKALVEVPLQNLTPEQYITLAVEAVEELGWELRYISPYGLVATTGFSWKSWGEEITVKITENGISIKSECAGNQVFDWGKNRQRIQAFLSKMVLLADTPHTVALEEKYTQLSQNFPPAEDDFLNQPLPTISQKLRGFLGAFVPAKNFVITPLLINLNILVFVWMVASGVSFFFPDVQDIISWGGNFKPLTLEGEWWRIMTSCFIHYGIFHLLFNMYALYYIGSRLEPFLGKVRYLVAYLLAGVTGGVTSLWWNDLVVSAGASGAIFGMYGLFLALLLTNLVEQSYRKSLLISISMFIGYNLIFGMQAGIDNAAHIGGLLGGMLIGFTLYPSIVEPENYKLKYLLLACATVVVIISSSFMYRSLPNSFSKYEELMQRVASNEAMALELYGFSKDAPREELMYQIKDRGQYYWELNLRLLDEVDALRGLPEPLKERNRLIREYIYLQIETYDLHYKAVEENTDVYLSQINRKNRQIELVLNELRGK